LGFFFICEYSLLPQVPLNFQDTPFQPSRYATPQEIDAYNQFVRIVNRNCRWMSCNGFFYECLEHMEIPLDWKVSRDIYMKDMERIQAVYWGQMKTIAIVGGCLGGLLFLVLVLL